MKQKSSQKPASTKKETLGELKKQSTSDDEVKKGYNEKNPGQPQGAFKPDNSSKKN